ncbi:proteobacterial dedicated sortase system response regulator [Biformimicrobium ophioploci]|uniref:Proteobacterial dedicated sortase system response regulator n=1 Tax=Biformimicrobium ophioploci TaxID=3036711 RepID=A0ABQ6M2U4_9GAMM|nr:proteobacterial dedicated sortase system response regulator [Microbulbifer sp. NKW57]GMG88597.1 proteobacterial dedicated sortase system response regulator [Microbulbifer sp. NKW57]
MSAVIAIVEDERAIAENYRDALRRSGFSVQLFETRAAAMESFRQKLPDLAVIDVGLGHEIEGGFDLCRDLRALAPTLPILFLTARDSELDIISGLRLGADDYLTKDISLPHMLARINALLRRVVLMNEARSDTDDLLSQGPLELDSSRMLCRWNDQPVDLTVTEFWIVHALAKRPGHVKSRGQLMEAAQVVLDDNTITSHVKRIRRKFQALDPDFDAIATAYGMGYRWQAGPA